MCSYPDSLLKGASNALGFPAEPQKKDEPLFREAKPESNSVRMLLRLSMILSTYNGHLPDTLPMV